MKSTLPVISLEQALDTVLAHAERLPPVEVALDAAVGRVLAEDIRSDTDLPPFDKAAMDGYAVRADDIAGVPSALQVVEDIPAGRAPERFVEKGQCAKIMTGAPVPRGADTVVMVEYTESSGDDEVRIMAVAAKGRNICFRGEDVKEGVVVVCEGTVLRPFDIALAADGVDIVDTVYDGSPADPGAQARLDFSKTLAFENFQLEMNPYVYEFSNIDMSDYSKLRGAAADFFVLFEFSAKEDPVPTMLTQCHVDLVNGFLGQTTSYNRETLKPSTLVLGEVPGTQEVKYIHSNFGRGTWTFFGGHDPEDYEHRVGDPPTKLELHKNSPGYRLILNNVLFPAAKKKERKT